MSNQDPFKVIFLGDTGVGKTTIIWRIIDQWGNVKPTIGANAYSYQHNGVEYSLFDTAGQEEYRSIVPLLIRNSSVVVLVFDVTDIKTFNSLREFYQQTQDILQNDVLYVIVGNKIDSNKAVSSEQISQLEDDLDTKCILTCALNGLNIGDIFEYISNKISSLNSPEEINVQPIEIKDNNNNNNNCC